MSIGVLKTAQPDPKGANWQSSTFFDDFYNYTTANLWTTVAGSSGTSAAYATGGVDKILFTTAATDNDVQGIITTKLGFNPYVTPNVQGMFCETLMDVVNQATTTANVAFGFSSTSTFLASNGAVPSASGSRAVIFKLDGEAVWRVQSSNGAVQVTNTTTMTAVDGQYLLRIDVFAFDLLNFGVSYKVNGAILNDATTGQPIIHKLPITSLADMGVVALVKAGSANVQLQYHDYITAGKARLINYSTSM